MNAILEAIIGTDTDYINTGAIIAKELSSLDLKHKLDLSAQVQPQLKAAHLTSAQDLH